MAAWKFTVALLGPYSVEFCVALISVLRNSIRHFCYALLATFCVVLIVIPNATLAHCCLWAGCCIICAMFRSGSVRSGSHWGAGAEWKREYLIRFWAIGWPRRHLLMLLCDMLLFVVLVCSEWWIHFAQHWMCGCNVVCVWVCSSETLNGPSDKVLTWYQLA